MSPTTDEQVQQLIDAVASTIGTDPVAWPGGWPDEPDTAVVDAVFSARANYRTTIRPLVERWRIWPGRPTGRTVDVLLEVDRDSFIAVTNQQRVPGRGPNRQLKADAVRQVAGSLVEAGLNTAAQIRHAAAVDRGVVRGVIERARGVGPAQSSYLLILLGSDGVKADTLVTAFVQRHVPGVRLSEVEAVVSQAAGKIHLPATQLDHAIWRHESDVRSRR